jgi:hypothetical protein
MPPSSGQSKKSREEFLDYSDNGDSKLLRNAGTDIPRYAASCTRKIKNFNNAT